MEQTEAPSAILTARNSGRVGCLHCGQVWPAGTHACDRCGAHLESRFPNSLQRVWAWWFAGLIAYVPANLYPMLVTDTLGHQSASTIVGGVFELIDYHAYFVAIVVFVASVVIPSLKFFAIAYLSIAVTRPTRGKTHRLHKIYEAVEFIGRWSMIDVFVVAILAALVHLGSVADIYPGIAAVSFAMTVIFTMLSALSFDPRLIWDALGEDDT